MITDFPRNPLANIAGLQSFLFSPMAAVSMLPPIINERIFSPVTFYGTGRFLNGYSTISLLSLTEIASNDDNGEAYDWTITGFAPGDGPDLLPLMRSMHRCKRHIVVTNDHNGIKRLVGYRSPLQFEYTYASGLEPGQDRKGYAFRFFGRGNKPAPIYSLG